ncbi:MAG: hypothetical protein LQ350_004597 [Teloschistes chrysophthalmus]|nr:MAG: hypothetical protein LQ350_004597 [Niorma chrysophthalma]
MHQLILGLFLYLTTGLAIPTPDDSLKSNSISSPPGFPARELPPLNISDFSIGNLHLPIRPDATLTQTITYDSSPFGPFDPGHLISSVIGKVYPLWRDTANAPILRSSEERSSPFTEVLLAIQPSLLVRTELTPLKVGIVYCWIVRQVLLESSWPGQITARISNADHGRVGRWVGTIRVINSPLRKTTENNTLQLPGLNNTSTPSLTNTPSELTSSALTTSPKPTRQKAWLQIFSEIMFFIYSRPPYKPVDDFTRRTGAKGRVTMHFPSIIIDGLEGRMFFYEGKPDLVWDQVAANVQQLAHLAISRDEWDCRETVNLGPVGTPYVSVVFTRSTEPYVSKGAAVPGAADVTTS